MNEVLDALVARDLRLERATSSQRAGAFLLDAAIIVAILLGLGLSLAPVG